MCGIHVCIKEFKVTGSFLRIQLESSWNVSLHTGHHYWALKLLT